MARLRDEFDQFEKRKVAILAIGPNSPMAFEQYWTKENIPFVGLSDPTHDVAKLYRQEVNLFKLGRMPLNCVLDANGYVRYAHYADSMRDIPSNATLLQVIDALNKSST